MTLLSRELVFISYSHKDKRWLSDLLIHLKPYLRDGSISFWSDRQIRPGSKWFAEIQEALDRARVAVLLVTPHFLASDFIHDNELAPLLADAEAKGLTLTWIHVRACSYAKSPIAKYQALVDPSKPLAQMRSERDDAWVRICRGIESAAIDVAGANAHRAEAPIAGRIEPAVPVVHGDYRPAGHRQLIRDLQRSINAGMLQDSLIASLVLDALSTDKKLALSPLYNLRTLIAGISLSDEYYVRVRSAAGERDWQRDFAVAVTPLLISLLRSLDRSPDAQALMVRICDRFAEKLRLRLVWPDSREEFNEFANELYRSCCRAAELECDEVVELLRRLPAAGPK